MKTRILIVVAGMILFYIGAEVGYQLAYNNITCIKYIPAKNNLII